jgi:hypothetical protein
MIKVQRQPRQKVSESPDFSKKVEYDAHTCHPSYTGSISRRIMVQAGWRKTVRTYLKNN